MNEKKAKKPNPKVLKEDNPVQSHAFRKAVAELEADGKLSHTDGEKGLEDVLGNAKTEKPKDE